MLHLLDMNHLNIHEEYHSPKSNFRSCLSVQYTGRWWMLLQCIANTIHVHHALGSNSFLRLFLYLCNVDMINVQSPISRYPSALHGINIYRSSDASFFFFLCSFISFNTSSHGASNLLHQPHLVMYGHSSPILMLFLQFRL